MIHVDVSIALQTRKSNRNMNEKKEHLECWNGPGRTCTKVDSTVSSSSCRFFFLFPPFFKWSNRNVSHKPENVTPTNGTGPGGRYEVWARTLTANVTHLTDFTLNLYVNSHFSRFHIHPSALVSATACPPILLLTRNIFNPINRAIISRKPTQMPFPIFYLSVCFFLFFPLSLFPFNLKPQLVHCTLSQSASSFASFFSSSRRISVIWMFFFFFVCEDNKCKWINSLAMWRHSVSTGNWNFFLFI